MEFRVLAIGDVTSEEGTAHLRRHLPGFKKMKGVDFTVINGENISGTGLTPQQADDLFAAGADVITLGNHTWGKMQITDYLEDNRYILRPANFSPRTPGRGCGVYDLGRVQVAVLCLIGRCDLAWGSDNPFTTADRLLKAGEKPPSPWWISTPRPPAKSWPWPIIWTAGCPPCGAPIPMCPPPMSGCFPRAPAISRTWA